MQAQERARQKSGKPPSTIRALGDLTQEDFIAGMVEAINVFRAEKIEFKPGARGKSVTAFVNFGRWIAACPFCAGAERVEPGEPFYCFSCGMRGNGGHPVAVVFPAEVVEIEKVLTVRRESTQNYFPHETLAQLRRENIAHALEV